MPPFRGTTPAERKSFYFCKCKYAVYNSHDSLRNMIHGIHSFPWRSPIMPQQGAENQNAMA